MSTLTNQKQDLQKRLKCGDIRSVINDVQECFKKESQENLALSLLCTVSSIVNADNVNVKTEDVYQLCYLCCETLKVESLTNDKYKFLCSLYHIIKYFVKQNNIETALALSSFVFLTNCEVDEENICNVYYNCYFLFHRVVVAKKQECVEDKVDLSSTITILKHSIKFLKCCIGKYLLYALDKATHFVHGLKLTNESNLQVVQLQLDILEFTYDEDSKICMNISSENVYKSYVCFLSSVLKILFEIKHLNKAQDVVNKTVACINKWNEEDAISNNCVGFLQNFLHSILEGSCDFAERLKDCDSVLKSLTFKYEDSKILHWTCMTIAQVLHYMNGYWSSYTAEEWNQYLPVDVQKALFSFVFHLCKLLLRSRCIKCTLPSGEECSVNNDTVASLNVLSVVIQCATFSVIHKTDGFIKLLPEALVSVTEIIERLKTLKVANCPAWKDFWKRYGIKVYNLGLHCSSTGLCHEAKDFFAKFCSTCIEFGEQPEIAEAKNEILVLGLQCLVHIYKELKKYRGGLRIVTVALIVLSNSKEIFLQQWAKIKTYAFSEKCKNIQTLTIYDILTQDKMKIEALCPNINLEAVNVPDLLILELKAYSWSSSSSWGCVQAVYNKLCSLISSNCCILQTQGLLAYLPSIWINGSVEQCTDIIPPVKRCIEALKEENPSVAMEKQQQLCLLGNLYFWLFWCQLKVSRSKQEEEMLRSNIVTSKTQLQQEDNHDPLEICDVIPAYRYLNLENETQTLEALNDAMKVWTSALQSGFNAASEDLGVLSNIEVASYMYELYGYYAQKLKAWCLFYKCAEILQNKEAMLLALCHLLEWCSCGMVTCKWLARAQNLIMLLKLEDKKEFESQLLFHKYLLASCLHCFRNKKFTEIADSIEKLIGFTKREKIQHFGQSILHVKVGLLISQCKCLPHSCTIIWPSKNEKPVFCEATRTYGNAMSLLKQAKMTPAENAQVLNLMLEVSQWLGRLCLELFWPREARCFMRRDLVLAQKLGLATRTAQFLNLLAQVDVMCCNVDDSQVKLQGMEVVLQLESRYQPYDITSKNRKAEIDTDLSSQLKQLTLERSIRMAEFRDIPRIPLRNRSPNASPTFRKAAFVPPDFVTHHMDCKCCMCNTLILQTLVLYVTYIQAQIYNCRSELKEALEFFEGGLQLYRQLAHKQTKLIGELNNDVHQLIPYHEDIKDFFQLLLHPLKLGYILLARSYADFMAGSNSYGHALKLNAENLQEVQKLKLILPHLVIDVTEQTFCIEQAPTQRKKESRASSLLPEEETPRKLVDTVTKTPLNTSSVSHRVLHPLSNSNFKMEDDSPFKMKPRKLVLPVSEYDDSSKENGQILISKSIQKATKIGSRKQKQSQTIVYEDSPINMEGKNVSSNSRVKQRSVRQLRSKTKSNLQKEVISSKHKTSEHESLSKICQVLKFGIESPSTCSVKNRKQKNSSVSNMKASVQNTVISCVDLTDFGLAGSDVSITEIDDEVFDTKSYSKQGRVFDKHVGVLRKSKPLRTYSKQTVEPEFSCKSTEKKSDACKIHVSHEETNVCVHNDNLFDSIYTTSATIGNNKTRTAKAQASSFIDDSEKKHVMRQTRGKGKTGGNYVSAPGNAKETVPSNLRNHDLDSIIITNCDKNYKQKETTLKKVDKKIKKGTEFLFTPLRNTRTVEFDETVVASSSPDEDVEMIIRKSKVESEELNGIKCNEKIILSSSPSEDETEMPLSKMSIKSRKVVSSVKKRQLPTRNRFILN